MSPERPVTVHDLARLKREHRKIVMVSAYDALFGGLAEQGGVDVVLVGDSVNTVLCGESTTLSATLDQMIYHGRIVRRGVTRALVVIDMPFLSYQVSAEDARRNGGRALKETGAHAARMLDDARALEAAGAFALVLELVPASVAQRITEALAIPTIGIGSGVHCDGQVLVLPDLLGLNEGFTPKFLKRYANLAEEVRGAVRAFGAEVRDGRYPDADHSFET
jgi:3-methyl-2-oxobutanoate hydroxymethyltransferase